MQLKSLQIASSLRLDDLLQPASSERQRHSEVDEYRRLIADLRARRQALRLSQVTLDERLGLTIGHINKFERFARRPTGWNLSKWVFALGGRLEVSWNEE